MAHTFKVGDKVRFKRYDYRIAWGQEVTISKVSYPGVINIAQVGDTTFAPDEFDLIRKNEFFIHEDKTGGKTFYQNGKPFDTIEDALSALQNFPCLYAEGNYMIVKNVGRYSVKEQQRVLAKKD